jgi:hypothetical protein
VAGRQQDAAGSFPYPNDVAGCGCAEDAILTDQQLLDTVGGTNLGDQLSDLWVPVAAITANDEDGAVDALRNGLEDAGNEGFRVVVLLEDPDLLAQARTGKEGRLARLELWKHWGNRIEHEKMSRLPQLELWGQESGTTIDLRSGLLVLEWLEFDCAYAHDVCWVLQAGVDAIEAIGVIKEWVGRP